jgi:hypothetical protein
MAFVMKEYIALDPMGIRFFGSIAVVASPDRVSDFIKELGFRR